MDRSEADDFITKYKQNCTCKSCGTNQELVLHHVDPATKKRDVATVFERYGYDAGIKELNSCIVLCYKCHMQLHGFYSCCYKDNLKLLADQLYANLVKGFLELRQKLQQDAFIKKDLKLYRNVCVQIISITNNMIYTYRNRTDFTQVKTLITNDLLFTKALEIYPISSQKEKPNETFHGKISGRNDVPNKNLGRFTRTAKR
jgi:hypothetical protein